MSKVKAVKVPLTPEQIVLKKVAKAKAAAKWYAKAKLNRVVAVPTEVPAPQFVPVTGPTSAK
jgi:hypothetical protein